MNIPAEFDDIRPFTPEELPAIFDKLLADADFLSVAKPFIGTDIPADMLRQQLHSCKDSLDFQKKFIYRPLKQLMSRCATDCTLDDAAIADKNANHTFVSNHRDIVLDAAILSILMIDNGYPDTVEIAIGDNLLIHPWIKNLVRINKSFIVQRSLSMREMLQSSKRMSEYMHFAIAEKRQNIWIAQREGRAKDSNDRTQESVLKMMAMGGEGSATERLRQLNIVPLTISYEYDPCDYLKAKEFQQKRDDASFKKTREDDLKNMQTGIFGYKGRVRYAMSPCINTWIDEAGTLPRGEVFRFIAQRMDQEIHSRYELFPNNYVAADLLEGGNRHSGHYSAEDRVRFEQYLAERIELIDLPDKDVEFLRERLLTMYANPLKNFYAAQS